MMRYARGILFIGLAIVVTGCAVPKHALSPQREGNRIVYTDAKTGQGVIVEIDPSLRYEERIERIREGVEFEGFLFSGASDKVLVTRLFIRDFEKVSGIAVHPTKERLRRLPPGTFLNSVYCELIRAHAVTIGDEIVLAAYKTSLLEEGIPCEPTDTIEAFSKRFPDRVEAFNAKADRSIHLRTD